MISILKLIKCKIIDSFPLILIGIGIITLGFTVWQLDILFVGRMWGGSLENIGFYQGLINDGFNTWASSNYFTINAELFPPGMFTTGFWYDALMGINVLSSLPIMVGSYLLNRKCNRYKKKLEQYENR
jgi:hypothetical protein